MSPSRKTPPRLVTPKSPGDLDLIIGTRLRQFRTACGMSQTDLGTVLGVTFQQIQKYERGRNRITAARLFRAAAHLQVELNDFFEELPPAQPPSQ